TVGRPLLYVTTDEFLKYFGLNTITDLPKPREIEEIMKDEDFQEQKRRIMMNGVEESAEEELLEKNSENESGLESDFEDETATE
ncbi:MAG: SMC-Scp complex subunit ScpB, partial [Bacteroidetes bacterium]|nr:SMC-Scp complex subunit ScpB [Bacteroidota bacterium]